MTNLTPVQAGRNFEDHVIEHVVRPTVGDAFENPVMVHGFKVDLGITPTLVIECKNRLDSHQGHRATAVAFALRHVGWRGLYLLAAPFMPEEGTTDRMVLDCALTSGVISGLLLTGTDPTRARCEFSALVHRNLIDVRR